MINALIIDDEQDACINIEYFLKKFFPSHINTIFFAHSSTEAERLMNEKSFNLFFVDIEMPYETGIEFAIRKSIVMKNIVFVTAFDQFAVSAFRLHAIDYILKPIDELIFKKSIQRILDENYIRDHKEIENIAKNIVAKNQINTMILRDKQRAEYVNIPDIIFIEAEKAYSNIRYKTSKEHKSFLASHNLAYYEEILEEYNFMRVHKSFLINKDHITKFLFKDSNLLLLNSYEIPVSRRKQSSLVKYL
jgi:two-component system LytT family response regulator